MACHVRRFPELLRFSALGTGYDIGFLVGKTGKMDNYILSFKVEEICIAIEICFKKYNTK